MIYAFAILLAFVFGFYFIQNAWLIWGISSEKDKKDILDYEENAKTAIRVEKISNNLMKGLETCWNELDEFLKNFQELTWTFYLLNNGAFYKTGKFGEVILNIDNTPQVNKDFVSYLDDGTALDEAFVEKHTELFKMGKFWSKKKLIRTVNERFAQFVNKTDKEIVEYFLPERERDLINSVHYVKENMEKFYKERYNDKNISFDEINRRAKEDYVSYLMDEIKKGTLPNGILPPEMMYYLKNFNEGEN